MSLINKKPFCILLLIIPAIQVNPYLFGRFASVSVKLRQPHIVQGDGRTFMHKNGILCVLRQLLMRFPLEFIKHNILLEQSLVAISYIFMRIYCLNHTSLKRLFSTNFCQAQSRPKLNFSWTEFSLDCWP